MVTQFVLLLVDSNHVIIVHCAPCWSSDVSPLTTHHTQDYVPESVVVMCAPGAVYGPTEANNTMHTVYNLSKYERVCVRPSRSRSISLTPTGRCCCWCACAHQARRLLLCVACAGRPGLHLVCVYDAGRPLGTAARGGVEHCVPHALSVRVGKRGAHPHHVGDHDQHYAGQLTAEHQLHGVVAEWGRGGGNGPEWGFGLGASCHSDRVLVGFLLLPFLSRA